MSFFICFELLFVFFCSSYTIHHKYWSFPRECFPLVFMTNINAINIMIVGIFCNRFRLGMENIGFLIINKLINSIPTKATTNIHCSETKSNLRFFLYLRKRRQGDTEIRFSTARLAWRLLFAMLLFARVDSSSSPSHTS